MKKINLSYRDYREACSDAFTVKISNPSIFYNTIDGFYVDSGLTPNDDVCLGLAYYSLNNNCERSFRGTRREYRPIATAIREYYSAGEGEFSLPQLIDWYQQRDMDEN